MIAGIDYVKMTALYWLFIVLSLIIPDLVVNGHGLLGLGRRIEQ